VSNFWLIFDQTILYCYLLHITRFTAPFPGPPRWAGARRELLDFKGKLTEADTPTIWQGTTPSGLSSAHLHHPPYFLQAGCPSCCPTNSVKALKATSAFRLGRRRYEFSSVVLPAPSPYRTQLPHNTAYAQTLKGSNSAILILTSSSAITEGLRNDLSQLHNCTKNHIWLEGLPFMWYKNIAVRFFGLVTKHACVRRTDGGMERIMTPKTALA